MTAEENEYPKRPVEPTSQRYGNAPSTDVVFDKTRSPIPPEFDEAPTTTDFLTDKELHKGRNIDG